MLEAYRKLKTKPKTKPKTSAELKEALQVIWENLPQGPIDKVVKDQCLCDSNKLLHKRCAKSMGRH